MRRLKPLCLSGALLLLPLAATAAMAATAAPTPPQHPANPADTLKEAVRLLDEGRFKQAAETFQRADDQSGGTCGPCLLGLSRAWAGLGRFEEAARQVLQSDPNGPAAKNARIVLCQAKIDGAPPPAPEELFADETESCGMMPPPPGSEEPKKVGDEVQRPEKIFGQPPFYTEQARKDNAEGVVLLDSIIDEDGCIQKLRVCKRAHHPDLNRAALDVVRRWVFRPAMYQDNPVKVYYTLTVNFQIGEHPGPGK